MSYDLNVLAMKQVQPISRKFDSDLLLLNEISDSEAERYCDIWKTMSIMDGIWYSVCTKPEDGEILNAYSICIADNEIEDYSTPYWIKNEDTIYDLVPLVIYRKYWPDFQIMMRDLVYHSPIKRVMFLARKQGTDEEVISGTIKIDEFFNMIESKQILFNVCYIICDE